MSVDKWAYNPEYCDVEPCPGDCDLCNLPNLMEEENRYSEPIKPWYDSVMEQKEKLKRWWERLDK